METVVLSQDRAYEWVERFQNGRQNVSDEHWSGGPVQSWLKTTPKSFFLEAICKLVDRWTSVLRSRGTTSKNKTQTISVSTLVKSYYNIPVI